MRINGEVILDWPLNKHSLTAGNYYADGSLHGAIDLAAKVGTPVYAAEDGVVEWVQPWDGVTKSGNSAQTYGNAVRIRHESYKGASLQTLYAHLDRILVFNGQKVKAGQQIALSGNTGASTGPHLHFEVRWGGKRYNPLCWLDSDFYPTPGWKPYTYGPGEHAVVRPQELNRTHYGIDLSKYNWAGKKPVDFKQVKEAGADFVILRAGYGSYPDQKDPYFEQGYREATAAGLAVGAYWYSYATSVMEAMKEVAQCHEAIKGKKLAMGVWFDQEYEPGILALSKAQRTAIVSAFTNELNAHGWLCGLYCSRDWLNSRLDASVLEGTELWVAAYTGGNSPGHTALPWGIWQKAGSSGRWPGVDGPCDLNEARKDYPAIIKAAGLCGFSAESEDKMTFEPVTNLELVAMPGKHACEIFSEPDVNKPIGKLPKEQVLEITGKGDTITIADMEGTWYKVLYFGKPAYVLALPDRCEVRAVEPEKPAEKPSVPAEGDITISGANAWQKHALLALAGKWGLTVQ